MTYTTFLRFLLEELSKSLIIIRKNRWTEVIDLIDNLEVDLCVRESVECLHKYHHHWEVILSTRYPQVRELSTSDVWLIHRLSTVCTQVIHRISTTYAQCIHRLSTVCTQDIHNLSTGYPQCVEWCRVAQRPCAQTVLRLATEPCRRGHQSQRPRCRARCREGI